MTNLSQAPVSTLERSRQIALDAGVRYVYAGSVPMHPGENTYCHGCGNLLIRRVGYNVTANRIAAGKCPKCGTTIPGIWSQEQALGSGPDDGDTSLTDIPSS